MAELKPANAIKHDCFGNPDAMRGIPLKVIAVDR